MVSALNATILLIAFCVVVFIHLYILFLACFHPHARPSDTSKHKIHFEMIFAVELVAIVMWAKLCFQHYYPFECDRTSKTINEKLENIQTTNSVHCAEKSFASIYDYYIKIRPIPH